MEYFATSNKEQCNNQGSSYNRPFKCLGRQLKQGKGTYRMDVERFSDSETVSGIGHTNDRPFRVRSELQGRSISLVATQSKSVEYRCSLNTMAKHECICVSPNRVDSQSVSALEEVSLPADTDSSSVAQETLVQGFSSDINSASKETANNRRFFVSAQNKNCSSKSSIFNLIAWPLSSEPSKIRDFHQRLENPWQHQ